MIVNKQKIFYFDLCVYFNVYTLMYINYFLNRWFLICSFDYDKFRNILFQTEVIFNIESTIYKLFHSD